MKWELPHLRERGRGSESGRCLLVKWELPHQREGGRGSESGRCLLVKWEMFFGGVSTALLLSSSERLMGLGTDQEPETAVGVVNNRPLSVTPE